MKLLIAAAMAAALAAPASAFDNTTCKTFLTGTWAIEMDQPMGDGTAHLSVRSIYKDDGSFWQVLNLTGENMEPQSAERAGKWDAAPGTTPDSCTATLAPVGEPPNTIELTVVDDNTVTTAQGATSKRVTE